jgi:hypothetical protein
VEVETPTGAAAEAVYMEELEVEVHTGVVLVDTVMQVRELHQEVEDPDVLPMLAVLIMVVMAQLVKLL